MSRDRLARAVDQLDGLIAGVRPDQGGDPTPCAEWDVDTLVAHIVDQTWQFAGVEPSGPGFRAAADALLARERTDEWQVTQQTVELATHAWDLARATGQPTAALDPEIATVALAFARENVKPEYRGPTAYFRDEVAVADDVPIPDRLAAFMGRDPT